MAQRAGVVVDVLEHVEEAHAGSREPRAEKRALVHERGAALSTEAARRSGRLSGYASQAPGQRRSPLVSEELAAARRCRSRRRRAPRRSRSGDRDAQHVAHHLAPGREPVVLRLDRREGREVVRVEAGGAHAPGDAAAATPSRAGVPGAAPAAGRAGLRRPRPATPAARADGAGAAGCSPRALAGPAAPTGEPPPRGDEAHRHARRRNPARRSAARPRASPPGWPPPGACRWRGGRAPAPRRRAARRPRAVAARGRRGRRWRSVS